MVVIRNAGFPGSRAALPEKVAEPEQVWPLPPGSLLADVLAFTRQHRIPHSHFNAGCKYPGLIRRMMDGRNPGLEITARVRKFMRDYRA